MPQPLQSTPLHNKALEIARETGFVLGPEIYRGSYYSVDKIRNIIFAGSYRGKPAVLKIYDDPRLTDEPVSQLAFLKLNTSKILKAPAVYQYKTISPRAGWLIMEKLPENARPFPQPVPDKKEFADLYFEYRSNFPLLPTRALALAENLPADEFHLFRIGRWLELASAKEAEILLSGGQATLIPREFVPRYQKALALIRKELKKRKMIWCHGHFKPHELFKLPDGTCYLTDFAHSKMYPEGYEFGFIVWADWMMAADWRMDFASYKKGFDEWEEIFLPIAKKLRVKNFPSLMRASLAERALGSLLADVCATDRPREEKQRRIVLLYRLLDEIL